MDFINEKIRVIVDKLNLWQNLESNPVSVYWTECMEYKNSNIPPQTGWRLFEQNQRLSGLDTHFWLHMKVDKVPYKSGKELRLCVKTGREGGWDANNPQFIVYLNGITIQGLDTNHTWLPLEYDTDYDIYMYLWSGMINSPFDLSVSVNTVDLRIEKLYYDIKVPYLCMQEFDENSYDYIKIRDTLDKALMNLDLRHVYSDDFYNSIKKVSNYLKKELYNEDCSACEGTVSCIGHTHIDIAWLWTVEQTKEKAQRSFSTVVNMMKRYKNYKFMSSQPLLYQYVKENDTELYDHIKSLIKEGRWEAEGGMWLEADTNLISGESLIRQIMLGKQFLKEEFGIDSNILWLPDVFGYSGALPQIMKKSGITRFFTTKLYWNETNPMPNDIFIWEGIDGSRVFAAFRKEYVKQLNPSDVYDSWKNFKNKSHTDTALLTFGFGDGGGGPTFEMMESYERLRQGIPGMPAVKIEKVGNFFQKAERDFKKNSAELKNTPKWVGEMYLEMHRGTYTSMAKNKKYNRKSEILYREAEMLSVTSMLMTGCMYPHDILKENERIILLNQFHDIIPGSSIKEVYNVTDAEYKKILADGKKIVDRNLSVLKENIKTDGGIFVYNPTPFEISDFIEYDGGTIYASNVPPNGWKVIENKIFENKIIVTDSYIENEKIKVIFNDKYHIVSVFDKEEMKEIIPKEEEANRIEIYEDYPRDYDAWEITEYYKQKMWIADDVSKVELLKNGIRIKRKYQQSEIIQDITIRNNSKRIDFITTIDWHEDHVLMKAAFPVDIHNVYATYDIQFGNLQRPTHKNTSWDAAKFEVCAHKWADLSEGNYGVSILNDCKYGYSIEDNIMKISLLKSATKPNPEADRGLHKFTYSLYPHKGDYREGGTVKEGYLLNMPLEIQGINKNEGILPEQYSLLQTNKESVVIETIKKAENDDSVIVRLYDSYNQKTYVDVTAAFDFKDVYICDLLENNIAKLDNNGRRVRILVKNFEIVTLKYVQ